MYTYMHTYIHACTYTYTYTQASERYLQHYHQIMGIERRVYADASTQTRKIKSSFERAQPYLEELQA